MSQSELLYKLEAPDDVGRRWLDRAWSALPSSGWLLPFILLVIWQVAAVREWAPSQILPAPRTVGATLWELSRSGDLLRNFGISLARIAGGFLAGGLFGVLLGIGMGLSPRFEQYVHPTFKAANQVPVLGWLPLAMMLLGIGEALKIVIIAQASLVPVALNTYRGIRGVPTVYLEVARVFKFTRLQLLRRVVLPAAVPAIFVGVRYGLTLAWLSLVTVELLASSEGLGFLIVWGRQLFQLDLVMAAIIVVGVVGSLLDAGLERVEKRLLRWRPSAVTSPSSAGRAL